MDTVQLHSSHSMEPFSTEALERFEHFLSRFWEDTRLVTKSAQADILTVGQLQALVSQAKWNTIKLVEAEKLIADLKRTAEQSESFS